MRSSSKIFVIAIVVIVLLVVFTGLFTVSEGQKALVLRLGQLKKDADNKAVIYEPGLHFKIPFITTDLVFDTRVQTLDIESSRIVTSEKKDVLVDYYVKWRISNLAKYYTSTGGLSQRAEQLLQQQINNGLRAQFGQRTIPEVVSDDRSQIMATLRQEADVTAKPLGIDVVDVRIKAIDLPKEVSSAVFARMRAERQRVAAEHRADGKSKGEAIRANADATVTVTLATAKQKAAIIRAKGQKTAAEIYAQAYNQNPDFYAFYRSLIAYEKTFDNKKDVLVIGPNSQFFNYINKTKTK